MPREKADGKGHKGAEIWGKQRPGIRRDGGCVAVPYGMTFPCSRLVSYTWVNFRGCFVGCSVGGTVGTSNCTVATVASQLTVAQNISALQLI